MDTSLPHFPPFCPSENINTVTQRWRRWKDKFDNFLVGFDITNTKRQRALLRHYIGDEVDDVFITLPDTGTDYEAALAALDKHFSSQQNTEFETYNFRQMHQEPRESLSQYAIRLRRQAATYAFADEDKEIKSQIILGCSSGKLRRHALQQHQISLADLLNFGRINETAVQHATAIENKAPQVLQMTSEPFTEQQAIAINHRENNQSRKPPHEKSQRGKQMQQNTNKFKQTTNKQGVKQDRSNTEGRHSSCSFCGEGWHADGLRNCRAQGKRCSHCNKLNHFAKVCKQRLDANREQHRHVSDRQAANLTHNGTDVTCNCHDYVLSNGVTSTSNRYETVLLQVGNAHIKFVIDSGATVNLLSHKDYISLNKPPPLVNSQAKVYGYGSKEPMPLSGAVTLDVIHNEKKHTIQFLVPRAEGMSLVCKDTALILGVIKFINNMEEVVNDPYINGLIQKHEQLFKGIGRIKGTQIVLNIDHNIKPIIQKLRRVPYHMRIKVEAEIQDLLDKDIIEVVPQNEPTPWISPVVIVPKQQDEKIRLCIDMKEANKAILRERSITPTVDDVMYRLNGAKIFSKLDMNKGYHQLLLHPQSRPITTFVTHQGLYRYKRLHFGVNTAAEIFQQEIAKILSGMPGVINVSDDILVFGSTLDEHNKALSLTLKTLEEAGVTLNKEKCLFNKTTLKFLGHVFSANGVTPDLSKVQAIQVLRRPQNPSEVRSFLGMVMFTSKFLPSLALMAKPLRQLTKHLQPWRWSNEQQQAFDKIKTSLSKASTLSYFDKSMKTEIWTDASPTGISAMLLQRAKNGDMNILAYASHALTDTEQRYSQIEREALALVWSTHYFHLYLYGSNFKLVTDHKPLVSLFADNRHPLTPRLERWKLKMQPYDYVVEYSPGKTNPTDYMSRHPIQDKGTTQAEKLAENYVNFMVSHALPRTMSTEEIKEQTKIDDTLSSVLEAIQTGDWCNRKEVNQRQWQAFRKIRHELSTTNSRDLVLRGPRIVLPTTLQSRIIELAHMGHQGIAKTKALLREKIWFPSMDRKVEAAVSRCHKCNTVTPERGGTSLNMSPLPEGPWHTINIDHKGPLPNGDHLLVIVDQYSKFPLVETVTSTSARQNIPRLEHIFSIFGTPLEVITDNGPPFNSSEFAAFSNRLNFKHHRIIPRWPQANGQVERFNAAIGKSLQISYSNSLDYKAHLDIMLKDYRSTAQCSTGCTPAELLFGYNIRSRIPDAKLMEHPINKESVLRRIDTVQQRAKECHDEHTRELEPAAVGDKVLIKNENRTKMMPFYFTQPYTVVKVKGSMVTARSGDNQLTRHRSHCKVIPAEMVIPYDKCQQSATSTQCTDSKNKDDNELPIDPMDNGTSNPEQQVQNPTAPDNIPQTMEVSKTIPQSAETNDKQTEEVKKGYNLRTATTKPKRLIEE